MSGELAKALAEAQANFGEVKKNCEAEVRGNRRYRYADLGSILAAILPALNERGLALTQHIGWEDGMVTVWTTLRHNTETAESQFKMPVTSTKPHDIGSAITYARRYALAAFFSIAAEDDDDGHAAQNASNGAPAQKAREAAPGPSDKDIERVLASFDLYGLGREHLEAWLGEWPPDAKGIAQLRVAYNSIKAGRTVKGLWEHDEEGGPASA